MGFGCKQGANCDFNHPSLDPKSGPCFNCGSEDHAKPERTAPKERGPSKPPITKGDHDSAGESDGIDELLQDILIGDLAATDAGTAEIDRDTPMIKICRVPDGAAGITGNAPKGVGPIAHTRARSRRL